MIKNESFEIRKNSFVIGDNGRKKYLICVCGNDKNINSPYCCNCQKEKARIRRQKNNTEIESEIILKREKRKESKVVTKKETKKYIDNKLIIEFYEKVEKRNFWCSSEELFGELISIFYHVFSSHNIDHLTPGKQLKLMWEMVSDKYHLITNP